MRTFSRQLVLLPILGSVFLFFVVFDLLTWHFHWFNTPLTGESVNLMVPTEVKPKQKFLVTWQVLGQGKIAKNVALFFGDTSSPSALKAVDSPQAVSYPQKTFDYWHGEYLLPSDFSTYLSAASAGKVFVRAYAYVDGQHLWSNEQVVSIKP